MLEQGLDKTSALVEEAYQLIQSGGLLDSGAVERLSRLLGAPSFTAWFTGEGVTEPASWFEEYLEQRAPVCA